MASLRVGLIVLTCSLATLVPLPLERVSARGPQEQPAAWTDAEKEAFLRTATVVRVRNAGVGVTESRRATLNDGRVTHDAHVQTIDVLQPGLIRLPGKPPEIDFRDSYKFNIAG